MKNDVMRIERSSWGTSRRVLAMFCAIVMFFTMNTFTFGALAEAPVAVCGFEEHLHGNECYDGEGQLICALPEHLHTADCFQSSAGEGTVLDQFLALDAQVTLVSPLNVLDDEDVVSEPVENISEEVAEELKDPKNDAEGQTPGADVTEVPDAVADDTVTDDTAEDGAPEGLDIQYEDAGASFALNGNTAFAGDVLAAAGLSLEGVTAIGEVVNGVIVEDDLAPDFTVAPVEDVPGEYLITVKQDFESAELGVVIDDVLSTVTLLNGVALKEDAEGSEEEEAGDETLTGDEDAEEASEEETDINEETEDGEGEEKPAALLTTLDFTNYVATAEGHSVFFYDATQVAVFASIEQLMDADGVTVTTEEIAEAPEADGKVTVDNGTLTIYGDGVAVAEDQAYVVTGITMPTSAVIGDGIIVYTADGEATLLNVEPVVETSTENYDDLFSLFQQAEEDPSLLARIADLFTAHAEETRTLQMELLNIGLQDLDDGSEVEPGRVRVRVSLPNALEGVDFKLYHIVDGRPVFIPDAHIFTDANGNAVGLDFYVDSLSPFAITYYTVDFEYNDPETGETFKWSFPGQGSYSLSEIMAMLGVSGAIESAELELIESQLIDGALYLTTAGDEYYLNSDVPFGDTYALTVVTGNKVYEIIVTDAQTSTNLSDFLTNAVIVAPTDADGKYVVEPEMEYSIKLTFAENNSLQFPSSGSLTYQLPAGLNCADGSSGKFDIKIARGNETYVIHENLYSINNGTLTLNFNENDPNIDKLKASATVRFTLAFNGEFSENVTEIPFTQEIKKQVTIDTSNSVTASKVGSVDYSNKKIWYTVNIQSKGKSANVVVSDTITGTGLTLNEQCEATSSTGASVSGTYSKNGNSFTYTIPSMSSGEIITFKYSADFDPASIPIKDGKVVTTAENTVKVKSDGDPEGDTVHVDNTIDYTPNIQKSVVGSETKNENTSVVTWKVTANPNPAVSMAGGKVTDRIHDNSFSIMKYSGTGITVKVLDASGAEVRTDKVSWATLGITDLEATKTWSYTIPDSDQGKAYQYDITYTTDVDTSKNSGVFQVNNHSETDGGKSSDQHADISGTKPGGDTPAQTTKKTVESVDLENKEVTWSITFVVPKKGLDTAVVTDTFPYIDQYNSGFGHPVYDPVKEGSISVTNLLDGEGFDVEYNTSNTVITFYKEKNGETTTPGLKGGNAPRVIKVTLKTEINDEYMEATKSAATYKKVRENTAKLNDEPVVKAQVEILPPTMKKTVSQYTTRKEGDTELPVYQYIVTFTGVSNAVNEIVDEFDTEVLMPYTPENVNYGYGEKPFIIWGGTSDTWNVKEAQIPVSYLVTSTGIKFVTSADTLPMTDTGFYSSYRLTYYLTVKDEAALQTLMRKAGTTDNGKYELTNRAVWQGNTGTAKITYTYDGLTKEILTSDADLSQTDQDIYADYKITINPGGAMMNGGEPMELVDEFENLSILYDTIKATPSTGVKWDFDGNTATFTVPDETKVVITYRARVTFSDKIEEGTSASKDIKNTATLKGYTKVIEKKATKTSNGSGAGEIPLIFLMKYEAGDMTHRLSGAEFALLDQDDKPITWGKSYKGHNAGDPVTFTTDEYGMIKIEGDEENYGWHLDLDTEYHLKEIKAPAGFMLMDYVSKFTISSTGTTDYGNFIYHSGDTMSAKNYPGTDVKVKKVWSDGNGNHDSDKVTVKLQQRINGGEFSDRIRIKPRTDWQDASKLEITLSKDNNWYGEFNKLPLSVPKDLDNPDAADVPVTYQIVETTVNGKTVDPDTVTIQRDSDNQYSYTVTNTAQTGGLTITKAVTVNGGVVPASDNTIADGTYTFEITGPDGYCETKTIKVTKGVAEGSIVLEGLKAGSYTIKETESTNANGITLAVDQTIEVKAGDQASANTAAFTNNLNATKDISITKTWADENDQDGYRPTAAQYKNMVHLYQGDTELTSYESVVTDNGNGTYTVSYSGLPKYSNGIEITYTVLEDAVEKYTATPDDRKVTEGGNITNTHEPETTSISITKTWAGDDDDLSMRPSKDAYANMVHLYEDDTEKTGVTPTVTDNGDNTYTVTYRNLPKKKNKTDIVYTIKENAVDGYTPSTTEGVANGESLTNTREKGDLELKKVLVGGDNTKTFPFTVKLKKADDSAVGNITLNASSTDTARNLTSIAFTAGVAKVDVKHNEVITITGIPAGWKYTVEETLSGDDYKGYSKTNESNVSGTISKDATPTAVITNTYGASTTFTPKAQKVFTNGTFSTDKFTFILTEVENATATTGTEKSHVSVSNRDAVSFSPVSYSLADLDGANSKTYYYTITEDIPEGAIVDNNYTIGGIRYDPMIHRIEVVVTDGGDGTLSKTIKLDGKEVEEANAVVTFTNEQLGKLIVTKTFDGNAVNDLTVEQKEAIKFSITGPTGFTTITEKPLSDKSFVEADGVYTLTLENIPLGEYTVTESNADIGNYKRTTTITVDSESSTDGKAILTVANTEKTVAFTNLYETPEIEKYVNKDVHYDLAAFDEIYTYDLVAYVTKDADEVKITDTLKNVLEFATTAKNVAVVDLGTENDHTVKTGTVTKVGTSVNGAVAAISDKTLTVTIADAKALRGHYVKVTFDAKLTISTWEEYEKAKQSVSGNTPVLGGIETHEGIPNDGSYEIKVGNNWDYKAKSNIVTVTPPTTELTVEKEWKDSENKVLTWPEGETVTVQLTKKVGSADPAVVADKTLTLNAANPSGKFENLPVFENVTYGVQEVKVEGYSSKIGTVTDGKITITNTEVKEPTFEKKVRDYNDSVSTDPEKVNGEEWNDSADYDIGDDVPFKLTAKLADNVTDYKTYYVTFSDTMEPGLTFNADSIKVTVNGRTQTANGLREKSNGFELTLTWGNGETNITNSALNSAVVEVEFTAKLNDKAVIGKTGNVNKAKLIYTNNPSSGQGGEPETDETPEDAVIVFTYKVDIDKVNEKDEALTGAEFKLEKKLANGTKKLIETVKNTAGTTFSFKGLDDGDYILTETRVPEGYAAIQPIEFTVTAEHNIVWNGEATTREYVLTDLTGDVTTGELKLTADTQLSTLSGKVKNTPPEEPKFDKKVIDTNDTTGETSKAQDSADYDIGDDVPFVLTATLASNVTDYLTYYVKFHDEMEKGLTFKEITKVSVNGTEVKKYDLTNSDQTFDLKLTWGDGKVKIADKTLNGAKVVVEFTATLNEDAKLGKEGNVNKAKLIYSSSPNVDKDGKPEDVPEETPEDSVIVFTYKVDINKVDEKGKPLTGAQFKLEKKLPGGKLEEIDRLTITYETTFSFTGLDDGDYVLTETKAPEWYQPIEPIEFTVTADHKVEWDGKSTTRNSVLTGLTGKTTSGELVLTPNLGKGILSGDVKNTPKDKSYPAYPATGGSGTAVYYVAGAILLLVAAGLLIGKRRMGKKN